MEPLFEYAPVAQPDRVDEENCIIYGCALSAVESTAGRLYEETAMSDLVTLSEGAQVYVKGHTKLGETRDPAERNGFIKSPRRDGRWNRGDWYLNPNHPSTKKILWDAKNNPAAIALSHEVMEYESDRKNKQLRVRRVKKLRDYALTTGPGGTNKSLFESQEADMADLKTVDDLRENYPPIFESACAMARKKADDDWKPKLDDLQQKVATLSAEADQKDAKIAELQGKLDEMERQRQTDARKRAIQKQAADMKVKAELSESTLTELVALSEDTVTNILKGMLTEDGEPSPDAGKPELSSTPGTATGKRKPYFSRRRFL